MWAKEAIMEKNRKRAQRRRDNARMLKRAYKMISSWYFSYEDQIREKELHYKWARQFRDNMKTCSCAGCGNPRRGIYNGRLERLTMQEIRAEDSYNDQIKELLTVDPNDNDE